MTVPNSTQVPQTIPSSLEEIFQTRRTVGAYAPNTEGLNEALKIAVEAARWAPNHRRTEPWNFYHLGPATIEKVLELNDQILTAAKGPEFAATKRQQWESIPGWLVVTCDKNPDPGIAEEDYAACACAIQNLTLSLWSKGIASKWSTGDLTQKPEFAQLCGINLDQARVIGLIWFGYPAKLPPASRKRSLEEILHQLQ